MASTYVNELVDFVDTYGAPVVFVVVALESLGVPLPGETMLIAVGTAAGLKHEPILPLFLLTWAGAFVGDNIGFAIGRRYGRRGIRRLGALLHLTDARLDGFEEKFRRYGVVIVVFARFLVPLRQLNGLIAGSLHMPWGRFAVANAVGAALWVGLWLVLSDRFSFVLEHLDHLHGVGIAVLALAVLAVGGFVLVRWRRGRKPA